MLHFLYWYRVISKETFIVDAYHLRVKNNQLKSLRYYFYLRIFFTHNAISFSNEIHNLNNSFTYHTSLEKPMPVDINYTVKRQMFMQTRFFPLNITYSIIMYVLYIPICKIRIPFTYIYTPYDKAFKFCSCFYLVWHKSKNQIRSRKIINNLANKVDILTLKISNHNTGFYFVSKPDPWLGWKLHGYISFEAETKVMVMIWQRRFLYRDGWNVLQWSVVQKVSTY